MASKSKESKSKKKRPRGHQYERVPQILSSRAEIAKEKLSKTPEYGILRPSERNNLAVELTDKAKLHELFETPPAPINGGGVSPSAPRRTDTSRISVKLYLARREGVEDREQTFTGSAARPDSIELRFEQFCSYGINSEAALQVGDQYFKWTRDSLVIPRGIKIRDDSLGAQPMSLGDEIPYELGETNKLDQFLELVAEYNGMHCYHPISRNSKKFVCDALARLGKTVQDYPLLQVFGNYYDRIKTCSIQDEFRNHRALDEYYKATDHATIVGNKRNVEYLFFVCVCFHVLDKATGDSAASRQWTCDEHDCCLPFLHSNLTPENLIFNDFWRRFTQ